MNRGETVSPPAPAQRAEVAGSADFSAIRYAQCWEDADVLLEGLGVREGDVCLSVASAGDNSLAMLARDPARVVAVDLSPAQLACLELRVGAYRELEHGQVLELIGSRFSERRPALYQRCRAGLSQATREFWDAHPRAVERGVGSAGKFERYFALFRRFVLPLVHGRRRVRRLLQGGGTAEDRRRFYREHWDTRRWRLMFKLFFSRTVMGRLGRDPSFFRYVTETDVGGRILRRAEHALTELDPAHNCYLQWILTGTHPEDSSALPFALRPENFEAIRRNLGRLEWRRQPVEDAAAESGPGTFDRFNLSDIFEYMSPQRYHELLAQLAAAGRPGGRLAYWNMLAPRRRPDAMADRLRPLAELSRRLHAQDKAFFYSDFVVEEVV